MVWSLSKDDDGLDSVLPLADEPIVVSPVGTPPAVSSAPVAQTRGPAAAPSGGAPSVVVDPTSQVPEAAVARRRPGGAVEATVVLKGRRLDNLRAEVARRRADHQRKKQRVLLLWAGAGGLALCLGWAVGAALSPQKAAGSDDARAADVQVPPDSAEAKSDAPREDVAPEAVGPSPPATDKVGAPEDLGTLRLTDLAEVPEEEAPAPEPEAEEAGAQGEDDGPTFTLDDLPAD